MVPHLPSELLTNVAEYLDASSLASFSTASKRCYQACLPVRYRQITLPRESHEKYMQLLASKAAYVRAVNIVADGRFRSEKLLALTVEPYRHAQRADYPKQRPYLALLKFLESTQIQDLYWSSDDPVPLRVVQFVEQRHARLHLQHFRPESYVPTRSLRSVSMAFRRQERAIPLLCEVLPSLEQLCLCGAEPPLDVGDGRGRVKRLYVDTTGAGGEQYRNPRTQWLAGTLPVLETWLDFSVLRVLHLESVNHADGEWLRQGRLSVVELKLGRYLDPLPRPAYFDAIPESVMRLTLMDVDMESLGRILERCRLTRLAVPNLVITQEWLGRYAKYCTMVELSVGVQRTDDMYESLGRLPLERLHLHYTSSWFELFMTRPSEQVKDVCRFHILRELAMDEKLARAVFRAVGRPWLELTVQASWPVIRYTWESVPGHISWGQIGWGQPSGGHAIPDLIRMLQYIARPFTCFASPQPGDRHHCVVRSTRVLGDVNDIAKGPRLGRAVAALWPGIEHAEFAEVWHSFGIGDRAEPQWEREE